MAGKIKSMIDELVRKQSNGNETIASLTRTKLILKGINVNNYTASSPDDENVIAQLRKVADEFGVKL